jgi:hypothetical protein
MNKMPEMSNFFNRVREEKKEEVVKFDPQKTLMPQPSVVPTQGQVDRAIRILIREGNSAEDASKIAQTSFLDNIKRWGFTLEEFKEN